MIAIYTIPKNNKITIVQDIVIGINTITHNLNLSNPKGFNITIIDNTDNSLTISNFQNFTNNSFDFISAIDRVNCTITIN